MRIMLVMNHLPLCTGLDFHTPTHSTQITRPLRRHLSPQSSRSALRRKPTEHIIRILVLGGCRPAFPVMILIFSSGHHVLISPASRANFVQLEVFRHVDGGLTCPV